MDTRSKYVVIPMIVLELDKFHIKTWYVSHYNMKSFLKEYMYHVKT